MIKMSFDSRVQALHKTPPEQTQDANPFPASRDRTPARRVAIVGFGTVGRSVAKILCARSDGLLRLTHICNRNVEYKKQPWVPHEVIWTEDFHAILSDDVDIVVELIGGLHPA
jgi:glutamyl-tRNA reductase